MLKTFFRGALAAVLALAFCGGLPPAPGPLPLPGPAPAWATTDFVTVTTAGIDIILDPNDPNATGFTGTLYATITGPLVLAAGGRVNPGRKAWTVTNGNISAFSLPITQDANPPGAAIWLTLVDASGRETELGPIVTTRVASVGLSSLLPLPGTFDQ